MGWFWADDDSSRKTSPPTPTLLSSQPDARTETSGGGGGCPMKHDAPSAQPSSTGRCPVDHSSSGGDINPLNQMPSSLAQRQISEAQGVYLPTDREISTIPKAKDGTRWEYPSAQQLYNAMVRKGFSQSGEHVESMLSVHNFLNEGAWKEILEWEKRASPATEPSLTRFTGRPATLSPKAFLYTSLFGGDEPFDRHDWYVDRDGKEVRYVIDYYEAPTEEDSAGVFYLDIRPALDTPGAAYQRIKKWTEETWTKAAGRDGLS